MPSSESGDFPMFTIPKLATVAATALLSSTIPYQKIDLKMSSPDGIQRLEQLWLVTYVDDARREVVAQAKLVTGEYAPLIATDVARLESMMPAARGLAKANNIEMRLIKFTGRLNIEEIRP
jgi:hypothetical protein